MTSEPRYSGLSTTKLCGRKMWIARRGTSVPEVWVHASPFTPGIYIKGSSLSEGTAAENHTDLEQLIQASVTKMQPISAKMERMWDEDATEEAAAAAYLEQMLADDDA